MLCRANVKRMNVSSLKKAWKVEPQWEVPGWGINELVLEASFSNCAQVVVDRFAEVKRKDPASQGRPRSGSQIERGALRVASLHQEFESLVVHRYRQAVEGMSEESTLPDIVHRSRTRSPRPDPLVLAMCQPDRLPILF